MSGGGCLITRDFLRMGLLFARKGMGVGNRKVGSPSFLDKTIKNLGPNTWNYQKTNICITQIQQWYQVT